MSYCSVEGKYTVGTSFSCSSKTSESLKIKLQCYNSS